MTDIIWEDPPPEEWGAPRSRADLMAQQLRAQPGRWARVAVKGSKTAASSAAHNIRVGRSVWGPEGSFEAVSRTVWTLSSVHHWTAQYRVYARYVGGADV